MDTTPAYIKMCNWPGIQDQRKEFRDGDVLASYRKEWKDVDEDTRKAYKEFDGISVYSELHPNIVNRELCVWLPYQHQLQEMLPFKGKCFALLERLWIWWTRPEVKVGYCESLEQLWLAFYMYEKQKKAWNGEKWVGLDDPSWMKVDEKA